MPNLAINNLTAPDAYTPASTLTGLPVVNHINLDVSNAAIYWQVAETNRLAGPAGFGAWGAEVFMSPGSRTITRANVVGVRFRAAVTAAGLAGRPQAQVTVEAVA